MAMFPRFFGEHPIAQSIEDQNNAVVSVSNSGFQVSKFEQLERFAKRADGSEVRLTPTIGHAGRYYIGVRGLLYISHPQDEEINHRVVVIFRTNRDSWSCYGFCKHSAIAECGNPDFQDEHAKVVAEQCTRSDNFEDVPYVRLQLQDADGRILKIEDDVWINCRSMLDIKHTVRVAHIGSIDQVSWEALSKKGQEVFNATFGDRDKEIVRKMSRQTPDRVSASPSPQPAPGGSLGSTASHRPPGSQRKSNKRGWESNNIFPSFQNSKAPRKYD